MEVIVILVILGMLVIVPVGIVVLVISLTRRSGQNQADGELSALRAETQRLREELQRLKPPGS